MNDLLFSTPWWLPTAIALAGIFVFVTGNKRQLARPRNVGAGLMVLALALVLVSYFVETDKEKVTRQSRELVKAVDDRDWTKMRTLLDPQVSLAVVSANIYANRDDMIHGAQAATEQYGLKNVVITSLDTTQAQTVITVDMDVLSSQDFTMGRPIPSSWRFEWERFGKDWSLYRITCLKIANEEGPAMKMRFPK